MDHDQADECAKPCAYQDQCDTCAAYWDRMVSEGLYRPGEGWTDRALFGFWPYPVGRP